MKTLLMDYSIISPGPVCMAPKSLGMVQQLELTFGIKLFSILSKQETEARTGIFHNILSSSTQVFHETLSDSVLQCLNIKRAGREHCKPMKGWGQLEIHTLQAGRHQVQPLKPHSAHKQPGSQQCHISGVQ